MASELSIFAHRKTGVAFVAAHLGAFTFRRGGHSVRGMESRLDDMNFYALRAALDWQIELGADEAIGDVPVNRYEVPEVTTRPAPAAAPVPQPLEEKVDAVAEARRLAGAAQDLDALRAAMEAFEHCELKRGARNLVFSDGNPAARVMIVGEGPGRDEDLQGKPFVGAAGKLLDKMFAAIGLARDAVDAENALYITNTVVWRPPQNREPTPDELAMMAPFLDRHIELAGPDVLVAVGNIACQALLGRKGITRLRGQWAERKGVPVIPMFHPAYLLRNPAAKREAWADLLSLQARLRELS